VRTQYIQPWLGDADPGMESFHRSIASFRRRTGKSVWAEHTCKEGLIVRRLATCPIDDE